MTTKIVNEARKEHNAGTPLLTESEQQQLDAWNATQRNYPRDACVPHLVAGQAAITPGAVALVAGNQRLTYRELNQRANQLAHYLQTLGVGPNVLVGLCVERSLDMVVGLLGILKAGGAYVPLDPSYPPDRLAFMMEDAQAPVLVTQQHLVSRLPAQQAQVICLDADAAALARQSTTDPLSAITADDLVYIIYTSGSTGRPKGVQITHGSLLNLIYWHQRVFAVTAADRATQLTSPAFDATGWELWPYLAIGASVYLLDEDSRVAPALCRDWLVEHAITITFLPTALAEGVMALEWPKTTALRYLDEHLRQVPLGESGELHIGGAGLARGYLNRPDLTEEKFIPHPFSDEPGARLYKTGDEARFLPDGQIAFMGRIDYQIKIRGYRIEPNEIMSVLNEHPAVQTSLVVAREDTAGDKRLVAYVVLSPGAVVSASSLREILAERLPDYMIPATFVQLDGMPLTSSGKVDRRALPAPDATNTLHDEVVAQPHTPTEERLVAIVAPLLGLEHISIDDNFFMLGGHSLLGTQVIAHVANAFGVDLSLRTLFSSPTIRQLSAEIERLIVVRVEAMSDEEARRLLE